MNQAALAERVGQWRIILALVFYGIIAGRAGRAALQDALNDSLDAALRARAATTEEEG